MQVTRIPPVAGLTARTRQRVLLVVADQYTVIAAGVVLDELRMQTDEGRRANEVVVEEGHLVATTGLTIRAVLVRILRFEQLAVDRPHHVLPTRQVRDDIERDVVIRDGTALAVDQAFVVVDRLLRPGLVEDRLAGARVDELSAGRLGLRGHLVVQGRLDAVAGFGAQHQRFDRRSVLELDRATGRPEVLVGLTVLLEPLAAVVDPVLRIRFGGGIVGTFRPVRRFAGDEAWLEVFQQHVHHRGRVVERASATGGGDSRHVSSRHHRATPVVDQRTAVRIWKNTGSEGHREGIFYRLIRHYVHIQVVRQRVVGEHREHVELLHRRVLRADAIEIALVREARVVTHRIARQFVQVAAVLAVAAEDAPGAEPHAGPRGVVGVQIVHRVAALLRIRVDRDLQAELLRDPGRLEVAPARVAGASESGAVGQPLHAVHRGLVLFFRRADLDLDLYLVILESAHDRGDRVAGPAVAVDAVTVAALAVGCWRTVAGRHIAEAGVEL